MKVFIGAVFLAGALLLFGKPASAMTEFCPAELHYAAVGSSSEGSTTPQPASVYGFDLSALGPRIATATLAFDTSGGWYTVDVPQTTLVEKDRHYEPFGSRTVLHDWITPIMYVRFPQAVAVNDAWVYAATATGDGTYGW